MVQFLLKNDDCTDKRLSLAEDSHYGHNENVRDLLGEVANPDADHPLHIAAREEHQKMKMLVESEAVHANHDGTPRLEFALLFDARVGSHNSARDSQSSSTHKIYLVLVRG